MITINHAKLKILLEAIALFAARGSYGLKIDDISQNAGLNKRMKIEQDFSNITTLGDIENFIKLNGENL